jgi:transposase-like protein
MANDAVQRKINETLRHTEKKRQVFIDVLREEGVIKVAAEAAGISRTTAYRWRNKWREFERDWDEALADALDDLKLEARKRAIEKSDPLLMFLLRAHEPETYDRKSGISVNAEVDADGAKITIARVAPGLIDELLSESELLGGNGNGEENGDAQNGE